MIPGPKFRQNLTCYRLLRVLPNRRCQREIAGSHHDAEAYRLARDEWEAEIKERRDKAAEELEARAAEQRQLAEDVRAGKAPLEAPLDESEVKDV